MIYTLYIVPYLYQIHIVLLYDTCFAVSICFWKLSYHRICIVSDTILVPIFMQRSLNHIRTRMLLKTIVPIFICLLFLFILIKELMCSWFLLLSAYLKVCLLCLRYILCNSLKWHNHFVLLCTDSNIISPCCTLVQRLKKKKKFTRICFILYSSFHHKLFFWGWNAKNNPSMHNTDCQYYGSKFQSANSNCSMWSTY